MGQRLNRLLRYAVIEDTRHRAAIWCNQNFGFHSGGLLVAFPARRATEELEQVAIGIALLNAVSPSLDIHAIGRKVIGKAAVELFGLHAGQIGRTQLGIADLGQPRGNEGDQ